MNSGLVLLLVAILYTTGCVNAEAITVNDAKRAITTAWNLYVGANRHPQQTYTATVKLDNGEDIVATCIFRRMHGTRLDCGLPQGKYLLPESKADKVGSWFITEIVPDGKYLPVMDKDYAGSKPLAIRKHSTIILSLIKTASI